MSHFTAIYDACVLYPAPLRDLLMHLALPGLYRARWSERIHEEWIHAVLKRRPDLSREALDWTRQQMDAAVPDCLVQGYEGLEAGLTLPDANDRHVLAAAVLYHAGTIVTYNLKDFPKWCSHHWASPPSIPTNLSSMRLDSIRRPCARPCGTSAHP